MATSSSATNTVNLGGIDLAQLMDALSDEELSQVPRLTAETVADFMADHERLKMREEDAILYFESYFRAHTHYRQRWTDLHHLAWSTTGPLNRVEVQASVVKLGEADEEQDRAVAQLQQALQKVIQNQAHLYAMGIDIMAHRPQALAASHPLLPPGQPLMVPVDTPTNGARVTDEEKLLYSFGLDIH